MSVLTTQRQPTKGQLLARFTNGIIPDSFLYQQEIRVQLAWAEGLSQIGILTPVELREIEKALLAACEEMEKGIFHWKIEDEDIHMNLERYVNEKTQSLGKKMHAGRSRNDLIATTLKLHVADSCQEIEVHLKALIQTMAVFAEKNIDVLIPGMTHLQNGQPIRFSHAILGHAWALKRDLERFEKLRFNSLRVMPLGSAALAGTTLPIDLKALAKKLGFESAPRNSYDSVGDRDALVEMLQASSFFGAHLSRLCEDIIYWASAPVGLIKLSPQWSTGSSIMPNKRNPDIAELARGKSALWMGDTSGMLTLLKGLGTCYGSDLHEAKIPYLRVTQDLLLTLEVFIPFMSELSVDREKARILLNHGHILATEVADALTQKGLAFRDAYALVAAMVEEADSHKLQIHELKNSHLIKITDMIDEDFFNRLSFESSIELRKYDGGTARSQVEKQINILLSL
jgi:argininosuccinate lyase